VVSDKLPANAADLERELEWLREVLAIRLKDFSEVAVLSVELPHPPTLKDKGSLFADLIAHYDMTVQERLLLVLSLVPHVRPELLDPLFATDRGTGRGFTRFGGIRGVNHGGFLPTGETFVFLAAGDDLAARFRAQDLFDAGHFFCAHRILWLEAVPEGEPFLSGPIVLSREMIDYLTIGASHKPGLSLQFPARLISTGLEWDDLVLEQSTFDQLEEIKTWLEHGDTLLKDWGMERRIRKGYRSLFYGPPGTGKSLTASLLGKLTGRDVYRIDLSMIVSKYIGETEKNLSRVFDRAENKNWILFFDEADALFGKRTDVSDAHDRYANQEVSYLLQRVEEFDGMAILASNQKDHLDDAFARRFESIISFPMPGPAERLKLWKQAIPGKARLSPEIDLARIAGEHDLSGGAIMNVIRYASLMALKRGSEEIIAGELMDGIRKEYRKEGRTVGRTRLTNDD
jgi:AAA+ superfamily predicted ATPase